MSSIKVDMPDKKGYFGEYGGRYVPPQLEGVLEEIAVAYEKYRQEKSFQDELSHYYEHYVGRPSPIFYAKNLTEKVGGAKIYL